MHNKATPKHRSRSKRLSSLHSFRVSYHSMSLSKQRETRIKREHCGAASMSRVSDGNDKGNESDGGQVVVDLMEEESDDDDVKVLRVPKAKRPRRTWKCVRCTFENDAEDTMCDMCDQHRDSGDEELEQPQQDQEWRCSKCDLRNVLSRIKCTVCQAAAPPPTLDRLKIVTLNVNGFGVSHSAPNGFAPMEPFSEELLQGNPDVVCIQEALDDDNMMYETLLPGYVCLGKAESHCEFAMLFIKEHMATHATIITTNAPAVLARVKFANHQSVVIGSCHLPPLKAGASARLSHMKEILSHCRSQDKVLIAGDYNMRQEEDPSFEALGIVEAWKEAGSDKEQKFTWNGFRNKYYATELGGGKGRTGRYDRMYLRGFTVDDFQMCANEPLSVNPGHFLSDHFGLRAVVRADNEEAADI